MVETVAKNAPVPVVMHLDHGDSFQLAQRAVKSGYTSVMFDGSHEKLQDNIQLTKRVVDFARLYGVPVEAELGKVGGKEDDLEAESGCTEPMEAAEFVLKTGVSSLAVAIGTAHGVYNKEPKLDVERLKEIRKVVDVPLVLHGASGLSDVAIKACIQAGICKVNFATELRIAYTEAVRSFLAEDVNAFDPKKYGSTAMKKVKEIIRMRMEICGCVNKAGDL